MNQQQRKIPKTFDAMYCIFAIYRNLETLTHEKTRQNTVHTDIGIKIFLHGRQDDKNYRLMRLPAAARSLKRNFFIIYAISNQKLLQIPFINQVYLMMENQD